MKKQIIVSALILTVAGAGIFGISQAQASETTNGRDSLIQKIADTFHLNKDDVQKVFDQHRTEHQAAKEKKFDDRLDQAVKDGKITSAQKQLILDKRKELGGKMQDYKSMTQKQRKATKQQERQDIKNWAQQNNIDLKFLKPGIGMGRGHWMMNK